MNEASWWAVNVEHMIVTVLVRIAAPKTVTIMVWRLPARR